MNFLSKQTGGSKEIEQRQNPDREIDLPPRRVVIYGNNWNDHIDDVTLWAKEWFEKEGLGDSIVVGGCKVRGAIENAFYGQNEDTDPRTVPSLVIAGQNIRDTQLGGFTDFPMESVIGQLQSLCDQYQVPLVRYSFDKEKNRPVITGGILELLK